MPVYNQIVWSVNSSNKTLCNFKYVCDVYVNGSYITRLKLFPAGVNGYASFKVNRVLEDYVSKNLHAGLYGFATNASSICSYQLKFGEEYDNSVGCISGTVVYPNLLVGSTQYAFNMAVQYRDWPTYNSATYSAYYSIAVMGAKGKHYLTNAPSTTMIGMGQECVVNMLNLDANVIKYAFIEVYDNTGYLLTSGRITNPYVAVSTTAEKILSFGTGPDNINNATLSYGTQPLITPVADYYVVSFLNTAFGTETPYIRYDMDKRTSKWEPKRLWWLNRLGGYDSYAYTMMDKKIVSTTKTEMSKLMGALNATPHWTYSIGDRGRTVMSVDAKQANTYTSNWLTELEAKWQEELFTSPDVYLSDVQKQIETGLHSV